MAVTFLAGFESSTLEGFTAFTGTPTASTAQARTGSTSLRCQRASGASASVQLSGTTLTGYLHFGLYFAALPTVTVRFTGLASNLHLFLTSTGKLRLSAFGTDSAATLSAGQWYWIGERGIAGTAVPAIQVDGVDDLVANVVPGAASLVLGPDQSDATATDMYFDDVIVDSAGYIAPSRVRLLVPTADSAVGAGWTLGSGGTTGLWDGVNNVPPTAVADTGTTAQIRNAASNTNSYDATMQTYAAAGIASGDTILAVQPVISTAAPVTTSSKQGTVGVVSNPTIANIALGAGGTAGAFWSGVAGGTYPTGWKTSFGTMTTSPSVTLGTAPVMRVTQATASTRIAMVAFMGIYVAVTPSTVVTYVPRSGFVNHQNPGVL